MTTIYLAGPINGCNDDEAHRSGKRVVLVIPEGTRISPWLRYHSHAIVSDLASVQL